MLAGDGSSGLPEDTKLLTTHRDIEFIKSLSELPQAHIDAELPLQPPQLQPQLELLYQATRDGFTSKQFYSKMHDQSHIIILIKSQHGMVFGGFTEMTYSRPESLNENMQARHRLARRSDPNAKVFSLTRQKVYPVQ